MAQTSPESKNNNSNRRHGKKALRGKPIFYDEKKERVQLMLTPKAKAIMDKFANAIGESRSEWLELHLRAIGGQAKENAPGQNQKDS